MNERIRQLAEQAEGSVRWGNPNNYEEYNRALDEWQEKFAELIVRECAKSVNDWYQNHDKIHCDPMSYVLAHFGVEE